jgi:uncharacterized membrane protein YdjX (TVP38/TMEM64 family)
MRSGCLSLVLRLCVALMAAILTVMGLALLFWFAVLTLGPPVETGKVLKVIAAFLAAGALFLVGRSVWRDLRRRQRRRQPVESTQGSEERGSTGEH